MSTQREQIGGQPFTADAVVSTPITLRSMLGPDGAKATPIADVIFSAHASNTQPITIRGTGYASGLTIAPNEKVQLADLRLEDDLWVLETLVAGEGVDVMILGGEL